MSILLLSEFGYHAVRVLEPWVAIREEHVSPKQTTQGPASPFSHLKGSSQTVIKSVGIQLYRACRVDALDLCLGMKLTGTTHDLHLTVAREGDHMFTPKKQKILNYLLPGTFKQLVESVTI